MLLETVGGLIINIARYITILQYYNKSIIYLPNELIDYHLIDLNVASPIKRAD